MGWRMERVVAAGQRVQQQQKGECHGRKETQWVMDRIMMYIVGIVIQLYY